MWVRKVTLDRQGLTYQDPKVNLAAQGFQENAAFLVLQVCQDNQDEMADQAFRVRKVTWA